MRFLCLLLLLLQTWSSSPLPVTLGGLSIGTPSERVAQRLGKPERIVNEDLKLYPGGLLVRTRDGQVVNLTASGAWSLRQGDRELVVCGQAPTPLGTPRLRYRRGDLQVWHYPATGADVGVMLREGTVVGFLLTEPGSLGWSLEESGYVQEVLSVPTP